MTILILSTEFRGHELSTEMISVSYFSAKLSIIQMDQMLMDQFKWIKTQNEDNIYICLFILVNFVQIEKLPMNEFHEDLTWVINQLTTCGGIDLELPFLTGYKLLHNIQQ